MSKAGFMQMTKLKLDCEHIVTLVLPAPNEGSLQFCYKCDDYRTVIFVDRRWVVRCASRKNCYISSARTYEEALRRLETHIKNKPHHVTKILRGFQVVGIYAGQADGYSVVAEDLIAEGENDGDDD